MRYFFALLLLLGADIAFAQLETWPTWSTAQPYVSKQVPPNAMIMRGIGTDAYYVLEVDPATGEIPVTANVTLNYDTNYGVVGADTLRTAAQVGNATGAADFNFGTPGAQTLRGAAMLGVGSTAVSNSNPVPISDAGGIITVDGTVAATQSGVWDITDITGTVSLPTGAATEVTLGSIDTKTPALGQALMAASAPVVIASDQTAVPISDAGGVITVDGTVAATQSGVWNITDITGTVSLPTGAATEATLSTLNGKVNSDFGTSGEAIRTAAQIGNTTGAADFSTGPVSGQTLRVVLPDDQPSIDVDITNLPATVDTNLGAPGASTIRTAAMLGVGSTAVSDTNPVPSSSVGTAYGDSARLAYASTNVTTGAWVELDASTAAVINKILLFDSSGQTLELGIGAGAAETRTLIIPPGGLDGWVPLRIAAGTRLSLRAISGTASTGEINFTGLQ